MMLGYNCNHCREMIAISEPGQIRDCPNCRCPARYTRPWGGKKKLA